MSKHRERQVYVDIDLDDFSDEDLLLECKSRGLFLAALPSGDDDDNTDRKRKLDEMIADAMAALMRKRMDAAETLVTDLIESVVGHHLLMAYSAIREGQTATALCHLDRHIDPPPSASATSLPSLHREAISERPGRAAVKSNPVVSNTQEEGT